MFDEIKYLIQAKNNNSDDCDDKYSKIRNNSHDTIS